MKQLFCYLFLALFIFGSQGVNAQIDFEVVCLEITTEEGISIIGLSANALEATQASLAAEGIESTLVDCDDTDLGDFDPTDIPDFPDFDPTDFPDFPDFDPTDLPDFGDLEFDFDFDPSDFEDLPDFGDFDFDFDPSDFEDLPDFGDFDFDITDLEIIDIDFGDYEDWGDVDPTDVPDFEDLELVCLEITVDGYTSVIGLTVNALEETQASLEEEGIESTLVDCDETDLSDLGDEDWGDFDPSDFEYEDWGDYDPGDFDPTDWENGDWGDFDPSDFEDGDWGDFDPTDCGDLGDYDPGDFDPTDFPDFEDLELVCLEVTVDGYTSVIGMSANALEEAQASLADEGIESVVVDCEEGLENEFTQYSYKQALLSNSLSNLAVYPNPAVQQNAININFDSPNEQVITVNVFNQLGKVVSNTQLRATTGTNNIELNNTDLVAGLYIVSLSNGQEMNLTQKLMVK